MNYFKLVLLSIFISLYSISTIGSVQGQAEGLGIQCNAPLCGKGEYLVTEGNCKFRCEKVTSESPLSDNIGSKFNIKIDTKLLFVILIILVLVGGLGVKLRPKNGN